MGAGGKPLLVNGWGAWVGAKVLKSGKSKPPVQHGMSACLVHSDTGGLGLTVNS